jgi:hypothetical protein
VTGDLFFGIALQRFRKGVTLLAETILVEDIPDKLSMTFGCLVPGDTGRQYLSSHVSASAPDPDAVTLRFLIPPDGHALTVLSVMKRWSSSSLISLPQTFTYPSLPRATRRRTVRSERRSLPATSARVNKWLTSTP